MSNCSAGMISILSLLLLAASHGVCQSTGQIPSSVKGGGIFSNSSSSSLASHKSTSSASLGALPSGSSSSPLSRSSTTTTSASSSISLGGLPPVSSSSSQASLSSKSTSSTSSQGVAVPGSSSSGTATSTSSTSAASSATSSHTVTSTMTTTPSGFSTIVTTNPEWTANTWITTTKDSKTTVLPVIVGCPSCGKGGAIILEYVPPIAGVQFNFLPKLKFSFPCIPILQKCDTAPVTGDGRGSDDSNQSKSSSKASTSYSSTKFSSSSSISSKSSTSTTSTSSCSAITMAVKDAVASCAVRSVSGSMSTSCFTTSTFTTTISGCSVTAKTTTSSAFCTITPGTVNWDGTETMPAFTPNWGQVALGADIPFTDAGYPNTTSSSSASSTSSKTSTSSKPSFTTSSKSSVSSASSSSVLHFTYDPTTTSTSSIMHFTYDPTTTSTAGSSVPTAPIGPQCISPNPTAGQVPFTRDQAVIGAEFFALNCTQTLSKSGNSSCMVQYSPCQDSHSREDINIIMTVAQLNWPSDTVRLNAAEMHTAILSIMDSCDLSTTTRKYGGWSVVQGSSLAGDGQSLRMYNMSASYLDVPETAPEGTWYFPTTLGGSATQCAEWYTSDTPHDNH